MHWMNRVGSEPNISGRNGKPPRGISMAEVWHFQCCHVSHQIFTSSSTQVAMHASEDDAWTVYRGRVFNITPYLHYHPGFTLFYNFCPWLRMAGREDA